MKKLREYTRPLELAALAGGMGSFVALVVGVTTRQIRHALIFGGIVFIVALVVISTLILSIDFDSDKNRKR